MLKRVALFAILTLFCATAALAAPGAKGADNSLPFYGGVQKTPAEQENDRRTVAEAIRRAGGQGKAVELVMGDGWASLKNGDPVTAIKYFNLAWLIEPKNPDVLWGFAAALNQQRKFPPALQLFETARQLSPKNARLLADYGYAWISKGALSDNTPDERTVSFAKALDLLAQAEALDPSNPMIFSNRAVVRYLQGRYVEAWKSVDQAEAIVPGSVDPKFLRDLEARMPRPQR
jgi:tetratricopeptide (TPR) repeat protein